MIFAELIAKELSLQPQQVETVIELLEEGNTVPFLARYRKERTGNLDEVQIRDIRDRLEYLTELEERRSSILKSIEEQGKLTQTLKKKINSATTKQKLEDLYLPYKQKRRTRATAAREKGLEPLALALKNQEGFDQELKAYLEKNEFDLSETPAIKGAQDILAEWISEDADLREKIRELSWENGILTAEPKKDYKDQSSKYETYYDYAESVKNMPAHRILAIRRGEKEGVLKAGIQAPVEEILSLIQESWLDKSKPHQELIESSIKDCYSRLISTSIEVEMRLKLKNQADEDSIITFSKNLKDLLLAPLGGKKTIIGIDPGFRTGSKWVVIDQTGQLLEHGTFYPVAAAKDKIQLAGNTLIEKVKEYSCEFICIGNGTASREVQQFVKDTLRENSKSEIEAILISESGASIYSASEIARAEFPELDITIRGAISIARRFQDPLAELVKIDPKSIGVGQYQHDVSQVKLKKSLDERVESCVNYVGVNLNTASAPLLSYVSGISKSMAENIITHRNEQGPFQERKELLKVKRFGAKSFEQSAGFLRILDGKNALDGSAVHPENYPIVLKMAEDLNISVQELVGNNSALTKINLDDYISDDVGRLTLIDIMEELKKPGRDPRKEYQSAKLDESIQTVADLKAGLILEGTITNITKFGAFVDIGVHQDGLVHISEISDSFIKEPSDVCSVGQIVKVRVLSVDTERQRIALSMRQEEGKKSKKQSEKKARAKAKPTAKPEQASELTGNFADDFSKLAEHFGSKK